MQILADAAWTDGWGHEDEVAEGLKGVGSDGKYGGNCLRDLLRLVKHLDIGDATPKPYLVSVKTAGGKEDRGGFLAPRTVAHLSTAARNRCLSDVGGWLELW